MFHKNTYFKLTGFTVLMMMTLFSCVNRDFEDLEPAKYPTDGDIFIDGFSAGLNYSAFGGSNVTAFDVDTEVKYDGTSSMKFAVPDAGDPRGGYAGGVYYTDVPRDLSGYDALTFWAKASKAASIDIVGFGNDLDQSNYQVSLRNVTVNTNWQKYIIPIPDPARLTMERGMFYYSEPPEDGAGYTFWIDELKFEKLGTLAHRKAGIQGKQDEEVFAEIGRIVSVQNLTQTVNLPTGVDQETEVAPAYFSFVSSQPSVASVGDNGEVTVLDTGITVITATLGDTEAIGSLTVNSIGEAVFPLTPAPVPTRSADSVISMYSNAYVNVPIDTWNTRWEFSTAEEEFIQVDGDDVIRYTNLNFVGIEFASQTIDASEMTHFHLDIWTPDPTGLPAAFKVLLVDFGADGNFDGGDDSSHELSFSSPLLVSESWVSIDVPLSSFAGLTNRGHLAQLVLSGDLSTVFVDNVYFYQSGTVSSSGPTTGAPTPPSRTPSDVVSIYSNAYTNVAGTDFFPDWGQSTVVSEVQIQGNNTLLYSGLNYQGIQLATSQDVSTLTHLHLDFWTDNSSDLNVYLISPGPVETAFSLSVPTSGWSSVDIPLSSFSPVDLTDVIQLKFDGNGTIYLDNIYFYSGSGGSGGNAPTVAAPTPGYNSADVISIFSDAFTNVAGTNLNPDWGQATVVSEILIEGNNTLKYAGLNYQGTEFGSNQDVSGMTYLHLDFWTANSTALNIFIISPGPVETAYALTVPTSGWSGIDIPLTDFSPVDLTNVFQIKIEGNGDIFLDNILFRK